MVGSSVGHKDIQFEEPIPEGFDTILSTRLSVVLYFSASENERKEQIYLRIDQKVSRNDLEHRSGATVLNHFI